ncbi:hypothetical protein AURDEDRAFT_70991, partial [Auricularia subglabra TFB-10046 SS5]
MLFDPPDPYSSLVAPSIQNTFSAYPLPRPPQSEFENIAAVNTIDSHPELFKIVTPINPARLADLLRDHPNRPFTASVITGLTEGFWPFANTRPSGAPLTADYTDHKPWPADKLRFYEETRDEEIAEGRWSHDFGPALLPGMYSSPIFAVPKPQSDKFRMVTDHSAGEYSLNSFIDRSSVPTKLDTVR